MSPSTPAPIIAVVGAGPGIGEAVAREFVSHGFRVALLARTEDKLQKMASGINADYTPSSASYFLTDLRDEDSVRASFAKIQREMGDVSVLVYNAGARRVNGREILNTTSEEFSNFTKINLHGAFWSLQCVLPSMLAAGKGTVLFTGATGSLRGSAGLSSFAPGKFGLRALCQIVTREYQSRGIHAAHIVVDTPVDGVLIGGVHKRRWEREGDEAKLKDVEGYLSQPKDIASMYWFLHSQPRSAWTHELDVRAQQIAMFSRL
jgi:NADP-dependent 3-hydroxy acid dehydrogenase YdfG